MCIRFASMRAKPHISLKLSGFHHAVCLSLDAARIVHEISAYGYIWQHCFPFSRYYYTQRCEGLHVRPFKCETWSSLRSSRQNTNHFPAADTRLWDSIPCYSPHKLPTCKHFLVWYLLARFLLSVILQMRDAERCKHIDACSWMVGKPLSYCYIGP